MDVQALETRRNDRAANKARRKSDADEFKLKGNELFKKGDYAKALMCYVCAVGMYGPQPVFMSNLAATFLKLEAFEDAEWAATIALEYDPQMLKARFRRGVARKHLSALSAAFADFEMILGYDHDCKETRRELLAVAGMLENGHSLGDVHEDEDYPHFDDEPWPGVSCSDSDTSDHDHTGEPKQGFACRFYNHGGCNRGRECGFSHAPDGKSVRDELGKNVCTYFLLGKCRFGDNCVYSHVRTYLPPRGWWNYPEQVKAARGLQSSVDDVTSFVDPYFKMALRENPNGRLFAARKRREDIFIELALRQNLILASFDQETTTTNSPEPVPSEHYVLLISLNDEDIKFTQIHTHFLTALRARTKYVQVCTSQQALKHLGSPNLISVMATDAAITRPKHKLLLDKLVEYVQNGGTVVVGGQFANDLLRVDFKLFASAWGLPWQYGPCERTTFIQNPENDLVKRNPSLATSCRMESVFITHIVRKQAVFRPQQSRLETTPTWMLLRIEAEELYEAAAALARVGSGHFGFIGELHGDASATTTTLALLGVLDKPHGNPTISGQRTYGRNSQTIVSGVDSSNRSLVRGKPILVLVLQENIERFEEVLSRQLAELRQHAEVKVTHTASHFIAELANSDVEGVYIADEGLSKPEYMTVLAKVVTFAKNGGLVVIGGLFPALAMPSEYLSIFRAFGLPWCAGDFTWVEATLNSSHTISVRNPTLFEAYTIKAANITGFHPEDLLYVRDPPHKNQVEAPILQARVGKGRLGYIGDAVANDGTTRVLLSMLDVFTPPAPILPDTQKFMIVLSTAAAFSEANSAFLNDTRKKMEVLLGLSDHRVVDFLKSPDLVGVLITDSRLCRPEHSRLTSKLVDYARNGGTVVFTSSFSNEITRVSFRSFFKDHWNLDWDIGCRHSATLLRNPQSLLRSSNASKLPKRLQVDAVYVNGISQSDSLYVTQNIPEVWSPPYQVFKSPTVYAETGKGHIVFFGFGNLDEEIGAALYAILGV